MQKLKKTTITKRWLKGSLLITAISLMLATFLLSFFIVGNYYDGARQAILSRLENISGQLFVASSVSPTERASTLNLMVEEFTESSKFEFMLIGQNGNIVSSTGSGTGYSGITSDYEIAMISDAGYGEYIGDSTQGEPIMSISIPVPYATANIVAIRMVTSLNGLQMAIINSIAVIFSVALIIFFFSILSGLIFVRSIVRPLSHMERIATRIADGDFNVRVEKRTNDEIGMLCDTINDMAGSLSESERMKNDFISSISHELRTPLTSIKGWAETLGTIGGDAQSTKKAMQVIGGEANRLTEMVEELLDFSRMQNSGLKLTVERIDLIAELADAVRMVHGRAVNEEVEILFDEPEVAAVITADKNRMRQVFLNILDNAVKYSPQGGKVHVSLIDERNEITVRIRDEGDGISPEELPHIKEKFYKASGAKKGSGIGLAVVDEIIKAHGAEMSFSAGHGKGLMVKIVMKK